MPAPHIRSLYSRRNGRSDCPVDIIPVLVYKVVEAVQQVYCLFSVTDSPMQREEWESET
jgi:hypothetical protein